MRTQIVESNTRLSESIVWKLNQSFYKDKGIDAWRDDEVPSHITSNSMVGKTYAELLFGILMDFRHENYDQRIYFLEMGAGHGKLAFYILTHLERLLDKNTIPLPKYTYILSDIAEKNLSFFSKNEQLKPFINNYLLDVSYFDASNNNPLILRHSQVTIDRKSLKYPIIGIGNYFIDSIPTDLYKVDRGELLEAHTLLSLDKSLSEENMSLNNLEFKFDYKRVDQERYNQYEYLLSFYKRNLENGYFFLPTSGIACMEYLESYSESGLIMFVMDKGYHKIEQFRNNKEPEMIQHGSTSVWVNFHALELQTRDKGGTILLPSHSHTHINVAVFGWLKKLNNLEHLSSNYKRSVDDFGPNEINSLMKTSYANIASLTLQEIIAILRANQFDPHYFEKVLPRLKQICLDISKINRDLLYEIIPKVYELYFYMGESKDFSYELGALMFDMTYYKEAVFYFQESYKRFGPKPDVYYNMAICFYLLRMDDAFLSVKKSANREFPNFKPLKQLDNLDLNAQ